MNTYRAMVRHSNNTGSGFGWVYTTARNSYEALQFFKAQYGTLLLNECVQPVTQYTR